MSGTYIPKTPGTIGNTVKNLTDRGLLTDPAPNTEPEKPTQATQASAPTIKRPTLKLRSVDIEQSLHVDSNAGASLNARLMAGDDMNEGVMELDIVDQMQAYDHNPRTERNPAYNEIKESIRQRGGLSGTLMVTRRPGETRYIPYMGQNTRFGALLELWQETGDARYRRIKVVYRSWKSESDTLFSHICENEVRGNTCWFDRARSIIEYRRLLEEECGRKLSAADLEKITKEAGMIVQRPIISLYDFAVSNLANLGVWLTKENVAAIRLHQKYLVEISNRLFKQTIFETNYLPKCDSLYLSFKSDIESIKNNDDDAGQQIALRGAVLDTLFGKLNELFADEIGIDSDKLVQLLEAVSEGSDFDINAILTSDAPINPQAPSRTNVASPQKDATVSARSAGVGKTEKLSKPQTPTYTPEANTSHASGTAAQSSVEPSNTPPAPTSPSNKFSSDPASQFAADATRFRNALEQFCDCTRIQQWLCTDPDLGLPYQFWLDLPVEMFSGECASILDIPDADGNQLSPEISGLRAAAFRMVAFLSGQLGGVIGSTEQDFARLLPEESLWRQAALVDSMSPESFVVQWTRQFFGTTPNDFSGICLAPRWEDLQRLTLDPICCDAWFEFLASYKQWDCHKQVTVA